MAAGGGVVSCVGAGDGIGGSRVSVTVRNVLNEGAAVVRGSWFLATVLRNSFAPSSLSLALWGGQEEGTPAKFKAVTSVKG